MREEVESMATDTKDFNYYMGLPYEAVIKHDEDGWFARVPDLPGCMTWADTYEELLPMIEDTKRGWIEDALEHGDPIPGPRSLERYSGKVNLRMPKTLHRDLVRAAEKEEVSLNQLMVTALAQWVGHSLPPGERPGAIGSTVSKVTVRQTRAREVRMAEDREFEDRVVGDTGIGEGRIVGDVEIGEDIRAGEDIEVGEDIRVGDEEAGDQVAERDERIE